MDNRTDKAGLLILLTSFLLISIMGFYLILESAKNKNAYAFVKCVNRALSNNITTDLAEYICSGDSNAN